MNNKIELMSTNLSKRHKRGAYFRLIFLLSTVLGVVLLCILLFTVINGAFGLVALQYEKDPALIFGSADPQQFTVGQLAELLKSNISSGLARKLEAERSFTGRSRTDLIELLNEYVLRLRVVESWTLTESLFNGKVIRAYAQKTYSNATVEFRFWLNLDFIVKPQASVPEKAGIRTAILGTLWMIIITILLAFPLGVGTAIYLEEYARDNLFNRIIKINIYNLAGVPSIIYGILGLVVFVRMLEPLTSGALFGYSDQATANGRTILSAGITLALLVLPIIIINAQEAIRAVPDTIRYSSYGLGATKWQTIWYHVLPNSMERLLTGTILAVSRAIGETAPLVVVGASTFIAVDPDSVFSKFTTLPIQIYQWTARPQSEFRNIAAAAIIVLLVLLLSLNAAAIILRNRISQKRRAN